MLSAQPLRSLLLAPLAILASCGDALAPGSLPGTYSLRRVAGEPLPAVIARNFYGTVIVYSEAVRLELDGTGRLSTLSEIVPHHVALPRAGPSIAEGDIRWAMRNGRLQIEHNCGALEICIPGPHLVGDLRDHTLRLRWGPQLSGRAPLDYVEVPAPQ